jgi:PAS domain S-box-containing protein
LEEKRLQQIALLCGLASLLLGTLYLSLLALDLHGLLPQAFLMSKVSALAFVFAGISLISLVARSKKHLTKTRVCAAILLLFSALIFSRVILLWELSFLGDPKKPGLTTALGWGLAGVGLFLSTQAKPKWYAEVLAILVSTLGLVTFLAYLYRAEELYDLATYTWMSLPTALGFMILGLGLVLALPNSQSLSLFTNSSYEGFLARRLLPAALFIPIVLDSTEQFIQGTRLYSEALGSALFTTADILVFGGLILWSVRAIGGLDGERRRLEKQHLRTIALLEQVSDSMVTVNEELRVLSWNKGAEQIYGWSAQEVLGKTVTETLATEYIGTSRAEIFNQFSSQGNWSGEVIQSTKDGRRLALLSSSSALKDGSGKIVGIASVNRDISERKRNEEELRRTAKELARSNQELQMFAYVASHDLQEPLRMVSSFVQLLEARYKGRLDESADKYIYYAVDGAKRMQKLINDLLLYSRVDSKEEAPTLVDTEALFEKILLVLSPAIKETGALISHDKLPAVLANGGQLAQVFQNLLSNALKFRKATEVPVIHVGAERSKAGWVFSVKDEGIGIEPQYVERIFRVFQRLHKREEFEGTGIGLSICKKVIERHGGRIWIESELGKGSTFRFTLSETESDSL